MGSKLGAKRSKLKKESIYLLRCGEREVVVVIISIGKKTVRMGGWEN